MNRRLREIFLSHSSRDRRFASQIVAALRAHRIPVWYSETHIVGAQQWHDEIGTALARCDWFAVILSPASVKSRWVRHELLYALREPRYHGRILPLLYKPCRFERLSWTLPGFQMISFANGLDRGCRNLFRVWGLRYHPPS